MSDIIASNKKKPSGPQNVNKESKKLFQCMICHQNLSTKCNLTKHTRTIHEGK